MNKKLPNIYRGEVINNSNKTVTFGLKEKKVNVKETIDKLFKQNQIYSKEVKFKTSTKEYETKIIGRTSEHIITINNEVIKIDNIKEIQIK